MNAIKYCQFFSQQVILFQPIMKYKLCTFQCNYYLFPQIFIFYCFLLINFIKMNKLSYLALISLIITAVFSQTTLLTNLVDIPSLQDLAPLSTTTINNTSSSSAFSNLVINPQRIIPYTDPNCAKYDNANNCLQCSFRYYFNSNGVCTKVSDQCSTWSNVTGACTSCYGGYRFYGSTCILGVSNCASYSGVACINCDTGYNLVSGNCVKNQPVLPTVPNCIAYNSPTASRLCVQCQTNYILISGNCIKNTPTLPIVQNCFTYDNGGVNRLCTSCIVGYSLVSNTCILQQTGCYQYNTFGQCISCFATYQLYQFKCYPYKTITNCINAAEAIINNVLTQVTCNQCASGYQLLNNLCHLISTSTQFLIENVTLDDNLISDQYTLSLFNQLQAITPTPSSVQCYNIQFINWNFNPNIATCDIQTQCSCNTKQVAIRTIATLNNQIFYWASESSSVWFSWPSTNFYFYYTNPTLQALNLYKATQLCDGTWTFQNNNGHYLSGNRLYSKTLGCAQKWRILQSRQGNGYFIQNVWNNGWLAFNGCRWQLSYYWRTKVRVQFWE